MSGKGSFKLLQNRTIVGEPRPLPYLVKPGFEILDWWQKWPSYVNGGTKWLEHYNFLVGELIKIGPRNTSIHVTSNDLPELHRSLSGELAYRQLGNQDDW